MNVLPLGGAAFSGVVTVIAVGTASYFATCAAAAATWGFDELAALEVGLPPVEEVGVTPVEVGVAPVEDVEPFDVLEHPVKITTTAIAAAVKLARL